MTDRYTGFVVTLEYDIRDDDAKPLLDAIRQIRGVVDVSPVTADIGTHMAEVRARTALRKKIARVLEEPCTLA